MLIREFENWPVSNSQSVRKGHIRLPNWEFQGASKKAIEKGPKRDEAFVYRSS